MITSSLFQHILTNNTYNNTPEWIWNIQSNMLFDSKRESDWKYFFQNNYYHYCFKYFQPFYILIIKNRIITIYLPFLVPSSKTKKRLFQKYIILLIIHIYFIVVHKATTIKQTSTLKKEVSKFKHPEVAGIFHFSFLKGGKIVCLPAGIYTADYILSIANK